MTEFRVVWNDLVTRTAIVRVDDDWDDESVFDALMRGDFVTSPNEIHSEFVTFVEEPVEVTE